MYLDTLVNSKMYIEKVTKDVESVVYEWQGMTLGSIWELGEDRIVSVMLSKVLEFRKIVRINILWYLQNFRIALSRAYIISSKKRTFFGPISSENSMTKERKKKKKKI